MTKTFTCTKCGGTDVFDAELKEAKCQCGGTFLPLFFGLEEAFNSKTKGPLEDAIRAKCSEIADFLCKKNRAYGNSVGSPIGIFAKRADALMSIDVRIDDKLSRLARGHEFPGDNDALDLTGYLILRMVIAGKELSK